MLQVAMGLLMLTLLVRDMLVEITARSETDPLSGLYNRRGFEQRVEPGLATLRKGGVPASLVVCDLDHFKAINDNYGHDMGDRVIAGFAAVLKRTAADRMTAAQLRRRIDHLGQQQFDEIRSVLRQEAMLSDPDNLRHVYAEFAAVFHELRAFAPDLLPLYFPSLTDVDDVVETLRDDVDAAMLLDY